MTTDDIRRAFEKAVDWCAAHKVFCTLAATFTVGVIVGLWIG